jgi:hypothetical protein
MPVMISTATMIKRLEGLLGTKDLTEREQVFIEKLARLSDAGQVTALSEPQLDWLSDLHARHFG